MHRRSTHAHWKLWRNLSPTNQSQNVPPAESPPSKSRRQSLREILARVKKAALSRIKMSSNLADLLLRHAQQTAGAQHTEQLGQRPERAVGRTGAERRSTAHYVNRPTVLLYRRGALLTRLCLARQESSTTMMYSQTRNSHRKKNRLWCNHNKRATLCLRAVRPKLLVAMPPRLDQQQSSPHCLPDLPHSIDRRSSK